VLLDPLATPDEVDGVTEVVLSNRHHKREAFEAADRFGAPVRVPRVGLHEFGVTSDMKATPGTRSDRFTLRSARAQAAAGAGRRGRGNHLRPDLGPLPAEPQTATSLTLSIWAGGETLGGIGVGNP
jgi:hypothetical protein